MDNDLLISKLTDILDSCQSIENFLQVICCMVFLIVVVGATFAFCKVAYKLLMRFS